MVPLPSRSCTASYPRVTKVKLFSAPNRISRPIQFSFLLASLLLAFVSTTAEVKLIGEDRKASLELWETMLGQLWIPKPGSAVIKHLEYEQSIEKVYDHPSVHVTTDDIVIDCGAHIGGFTRTAL